jgi:ribosome-binding factor A
MRHYTSSRDGFRSLCAEIGDDDGQGPQIHSSRKSPARRGRSRHAELAASTGDRKAWQLCRQVGHTLDEVLAECGDAVLQGLRVEGVEPFPDAARLLVTVAFIDDRPGRMVDLARVLDHIERASGHLRYEVATAVTRRRAPVLLYRLAERPGGLIGNLPPGNIDDHAAPTRA